MWTAEIARVPDGRGGNRQGLIWHAGLVEGNVRFREHGDLKTAPAFSTVGILAPLPAEFEARSKTAHRYAELHDRHAKRQAELAGINAELTTLAAQEREAVLAGGKKEAEHFGRKQQLEGKRLAAEAALAVLSTELVSLWQKIQVEASGFMALAGGKMFAEMTAKRKALLEELAKCGHLVRQLAETDATIRVLRNRMDPQDAPAFLTRELPRPPAGPAPPPAPEAPVLATSHQKKVLAEV
jgi:hypothetical protein